MLTRDDDLFVFAVTMRAVVRELLAGWQKGDSNRGNLVVSPERADRLLELVTVGTPAVLRVEERVPVKAAPDGGANQALPAPIAPLDPVPTAWPLYPTEMVVCGCRVWLSADKAWAAHAAERFMVDVFKVAYPHAWKAGPRG